MDEAPSELRSKAQQRASTSVAPMSMSNCERAPSRYLPEPKSQRYWRKQINPARGQFGVITYTVINALAMHL